MSALDGIAQQQNSFTIAFGDMKLRKQMQDEMIRQATIDNLMHYLQASYEKRHAEGVAKNQRNQQNIIRGATTVATLGASELFSGMSQVPGLPPGNLDNAVWPNAAPQAGGDFMGNMGGVGYA